MNLRDPLTTTVAPTTPVITALTGRRPGTLDYDIASDMLAAEFDSRTAAAMLRRYRHRLVDLSVETVSTLHLSATRLVITTGYATEVTRPKR